MCHIWFMASVNMRQLRDTKRLKALLRAGTTVELRERDKVIARIVPEKQEAKPVQWPDFGDRVLTIVDDMIKDRGRF
jgi:antitoxin (DNA-binding transcriptional repressor) of toxin-antitoxin stability system